MLGADLPESQRNRLLRRVDWRFLLPTLHVDTAVCYGAGDLREGVGLVAGRIVAGEETGPGECDLAVIENPDAATLARAWAALRPGGVCYTEWGRGAGPGRIARRLSAAGFRGARSYLAWPSPLAPYAWIPLDGAAGFRYFRRHLHARTRTRELLGRVYRAAVSAAARLGLAGPLSVVARKPTTEGDAGAEPELLAMVRAKASRVSLGPGTPAVLLLTRGPRAGNKIVALVLGDRADHPLLAVKIARVPEARPGLLREAAALTGLMAACGQRLAGAPRVLFAADREDGAAVGETPLPGAPLHAFLGRRNYRRFALQGTDWLIGLAGCTHAATTSGEGLIDEALADFARSFGEVADPHHLAYTTGALAGLTGLPRVCEHRDFAPWNVFVTARGGLAVLDWESSEPHGLPGLDLEYFLTYLAFAFERARDHATMIRSYRALLDRSSFTGRVHRECVEQYAGAVGVKTADFHAVRLLTWVIHSRSEFRRLSADAVGTPSREALAESLFVGLWREEVRGGA